MRHQGKGHPTPARNPLYLRPDRRIIALSTGLVTRSNQPKGHTIMELAALLYLAHHLPEDQARIARAALGGRKPTQKGMQDFIDRLELWDERN